MCKIKNLVALLIILTIGGITSQMWGMNTSEEKINVVFSLAPQDGKLHLYALNKNVDAQTLEKAGAVKRTFSPSCNTYTCYTLSKEKPTPQGTNWIDLGKVTLTDGNYGLDKQLGQITDEKLKNEITTILNKRYFLKTLASLFETNEPDPVVLVQIKEKNVFVLVKTSVTSGVKATTPTAEDLKTITCQKIVAIDKDKKKITNIYKFDGATAPTGYELILVGSYSDDKKRFTYTYDVKNQTYTFLNKIGGDKFFNKIDAFVGNIETNIDNYNKPPVPVEEDTISYQQPKEQPKQLSEKTDKNQKQLTSPLATIVYSTLSSLCGLFWGTIQSYIDTIPAARNHRIKTGLTTLALTGVTTGLLMNKTMLDKRADRRWVIGTTAVSTWIASRCGKQVLNATCATIKKYWTRKH